METDTIKPLSIRRATSSPSFPFIDSAPATVAFLLCLAHAEIIPTSGPLFPLLCSALLLHVVCSSLRSLLKCYPLERTFPALPFPVSSSHPATICLSCFIFLHSISHCLKLYYMLAFLFRLSLLADSKSHEDRNLACTVANIENVW